MTPSNLISMILLAIVDALNPATITTMAIILPIVKKKWHSGIFIAGTFLVYLIAGTLIYLGVDRYLHTLFSMLATGFSAYIGYLEIAMAVALLASSIFQSIRLAKKLFRGERSRKDYMAGVVKMVNPLALLFLSIVSTFMDIPTAIPYFGFIAMLSESRMPLALVIVLFNAYCFIYILPMIVLYSLYALIKEELYCRIERTFRKIINNVSEYLMPIMLLIIGVIIGIDGISRL